VSTQAITGIAEESDLSNLSLSRKEDFLLFAETPPRVQPEELNRIQLEGLSEAARADRDRRRRVWHANLGPLKTPQLIELHEDMWDIVDSNAQDGDKVKGAIAVDAFPGLGKTTAVLDFAKKFHLREIAENGQFTPDGHERLPVCRVGLTGNTGMKDFNRAVLEFYGHSGRHRGTTAQMAHRALDCVQSCHTRLLVIKAGTKMRMSPAAMFEHGLARAGYIEVPRDPHLGYEFLATRWRTIQHYGVEIDSRRYSGGGGGQAERQRDPRQRVGRARQGGGRAEHPEPAADIAGDIGE
jgi:hypothetical protein